MHLDPPKREGVRKFTGGVAVVLVCDRAACKMSMSRPVGGGVIRTEYS